MLHILGEIKMARNQMSENKDKYSLRGRIYQQLRNDILSGKYEAKTELREVALGEEMGVSRTPVREALRQLALEGLVEILPNKGAYVIGISDKDIYDIYVIRSLLEGMCARWATEYIKKNQIEEMEESVLLSEFYLNKVIMIRFTKWMAVFMKLYEASNSKILNHVLSDFHCYVQQARRQSISKENRAFQSLDEHRAILEAIKNKDGDLAEKLTTQHIKNTIENIRQMNMKKTEDDL